MNVELARVTHRAVVITESAHEILIRRHIRLLHEVISAAPSWWLLIWPPILLMALWPFLFRDVRKVTVDWLRGNWATVREWMFEFATFEASLYLILGQPESVPTWVLFV